MGLKQRDTDQMALERGKGIQQESMSVDCSRDEYVSLVVCDKCDNCNLSDDLEIVPVTRKYNRTTKHINSGKEI